MAFQQPQRRLKAVHAPSRSYSDQEDDGDKLSSSVDSAVVVFGGRLPRQIRPRSSDDALSWHVVPSAPSPQSCTLSDAASESSTSSSARDGKAVAAATSLLMAPVHDGNGRFTCAISSEDDDNLSSPYYYNESLAYTSDGGELSASDASDDLVRAAIALGPTSRARSSPHTTTTTTVNITSSTRSLLSEEEEEEEEEEDSLASITFGTSSSSTSSDNDRRLHDASFHTANARDTTTNSWALTEAALSTIPDATMQHSTLVHKAASADLTSDSSQSPLSSEDESLTGLVGSRRGRRRFSKRRTATTRAGAHALLETDDEQVEDNSAVRFMRLSYPTPPPETRTKANKRRHRQSGRARGSQKKSSTSGSVAGNEQRRSAAGSVLTRRHHIEDSSQTTVSVPKNEATLIRATLPLGSVVAKVLTVDQGTLELLSRQEPDTPGATPTPSRSTSPHRYLQSTPRPRTTKRDGYDVEALARHARQELGGGDMTPMFFIAADGQEEEEDVGDETETEMGHSAAMHEKLSTPVPNAPVARWVHAATPPVFAPRPTSPRQRDGGAKEAGNDLALATTMPPRSYSTSSVPAFLAALKRTDVQHTSIPSRGRRASFLSSTDSSSSLRRHHHSLAIDGIDYDSNISEPLSVTSSTSSSSSSSSPWGGEIERFEAAMSYWRLLLNKLRGVVVGGNVETDDHMSRSLSSSAMDQHERQQHQQQSLPLTTPTSSLSSLKSDQLVIKDDESSNVLWDPSSMQVDQDEEELEWSIEVKATKIQVAL
ncbi:hypothetical protein OIV83_003125 [Microbotryomycetes sp. JL201]|nr:hypothetical protein OIV83_003125 [Microbotryomycetes sp. JL201]